MTAVRYLVHEDENNDGHCDCDSKFLFVGSMTGSGKLSIAYLATAILKKITIFVVPTVALGVDQDEKLFQSLKVRGVLEYLHCHRLQSGGLKEPENKKIQDWLANHMTKPIRLRPGVILFCNPDVIFDLKGPDSRWHFLVKTVGDEVGLMVLDEAHLAVEQASFRPAYKHINKIVKAVPCTKLAMTATFTEDYATRFQSHIDAKFTKRIWSDAFAFSRANSVKIRLVVRNSSTFSKVLNQEVLDLLNSGKNENLLVFSNRAQRAVNLADRISTLLEAREAGDEEQSLESHDSDYTDSSGEESDDDDWSSDDEEGDDGESQAEQSFVFHDSDFSGSDHDHQSSEDEEGEDDQQMPQMQDGRSHDECEHDYYSCDDDKMGSDDEEPAGEANEEGENEREENTRYHQFIWRGTQYLC